VTLPTSHTALLLDDIRNQIAPHDDALKEARGRRDAVCDAAETFGSTNRTFASGSIAHRTANCPIHHRDAGLDADCGVVMDRRVFPNLGPDSVLRGGPNTLVNAVAEHLERELKPKYPKLKVKVTKRAILLTFNEPLSGGEDPTVDIVVGLDRVNLPGLWIPNTETNSWDPSDPEMHTTLLTASPADLRLVRQHAIRLAKAENKHTDTPPLCSFNLEAFGLMFVKPGMSDAEALLAIWRDGAADLAWRLTPDPAGVSVDIKVENYQWALESLRYAAGQLQSALEHDHDPEWVRRCLAPLFPDFVPAAAGAKTKARLAAESRNPGLQLSIGASGVLGVAGARVNTNVRSYGEPA
jgi:hypothetical protein